MKIQLLLFRGKDDASFVGYVRATPPVSASFVPPTEATSCLLASGGGSVNSGPAVGSGEATAGLLYPSGYGGHHPGRGKVSGLWGMSGVPLSSSGKAPV